MKTVAILLAGMLLFGCMTPETSGTTGTSRDLEPSSTEPGVSVSGSLAVGIEKTL